MNNINEITTIPLWWLAAATPVLVAFIFWISKLFFNNDRNHQRITSIENNVAALMNMKEDLAVIKYKLGITKE